MPARTAKVFNNGGSQAVRLPAEYRVDTTEVLVERVGQSLLITPKRRGGWEAFFSRPPAVPADFLADRRDDPPQPRDDLS
jgi:antitoxin VapB